MTLDVVGVHLYTLQAEIRKGSFVNRVLVVKFNRDFVNDLVDLISSLSLRWTKCFARMFFTVSIPL